MIDHATRVTPKELLGDPITHNYDMIQGMHWYLMHNRPTFTYQAIHDMSTDPRIQFGLGLIRGPLQAHADWEIEASSTEVEKFVREQLEWFWLISARKALASLEWGFSGS